MPESDNENADKNTENNQPANGKTIYFYIAVCACVLGAVACGLAFTRLGVYALICSVVFELASLAFCNAQKKANNFKAVKYVKICAYVLLGIFIAVFVGGIIYVAVTA